ncbi:MAG: protease modulator HflC [Planctomycetes bacterium]|nr:protease modulator HflC [Planctomycetota bacterium]
MKRIPALTLVTASALVLILAAYAVTFVVRFNEVAVKVRLGKADRSSVITDAGLKWRWPWPIESIVKYDKRLQVLDTPESEVKTADNKNVIVGVYAFWKIAAPLEFFISVQTQRGAEEKLRARINEARAVVVGQHEMASFVSLDPDLVDNAYNKMEEQMLALAKPGVERDFGIALTRVCLRRISLPEQTTQQVFQAMIQEREATAASYREEGKSIGEKIKAGAEANSNAILAFANSRAAEIRSTGVKGATRILEEIEEGDEDFFIWLRKIEALEAALKEKATIFFDSNEQLFKLFSETPEASPAIPAGVGKDSPTGAAPGPAQND